VCAGTLRLHVCGAVADERCCLYESLCAHICVRALSVVSARAFYAVV